MQMNKAELKDLKAEDSEGKSLTFDPWEISQIVNTNRYANHCHSEAGEDVRLKDLNREEFEEFLRSPACTEYQNRVGYTTTLPPPNLSPPR